MKATRKYHTVLNPNAHLSPGLSALTMTITCVTSTVSIGCPDGSYDSCGDAGVNSVTKCTGDIGGGDDAPISTMPIAPPSGSPGGGGGGYAFPNPQQPQDPCSELKALHSNVKYQEKFEELDKSTILNKKVETGYEEDTGGNFTALNPATSTTTTDGLTVNMNNIRGFIHSHINEYETGNTDFDGNPEVKQPIKMFSPADVNTLMEIAKGRGSGDYADIYGTMISSTGNYTIKFTGTVADIKTGFDSALWAKKFVKYFQTHRGTLETKFLNFVTDEMKLKGIELYKVTVKSNSQSAQKIILNDKGKAILGNKCSQS